MEPPGGSNTRRGFCSRSSGGSAAIVAATKQSRASCDRGEPPSRPPRARPSGSRRRQPAESNRLAQARIYFRSRPITLHIILTLGYSCRSFHEPWARGNAQPVPRRPRAPLRVLRGPHPRAFVRSAAYPACTSPCQCFVSVLTSRHAWLGSGLGGSSPGLPSYLISAGRGRPPWVHRAVTLPRNSSYL
jgi:hypothetical protein